MFRKFAANDDPSIPCSFSKTNINFDTDKHLLQVEAERVDVLTITNKSTTRLFQFVLPPEVHKYSLSVTPISSVIFKV